MNEHEEEAFWEATREEFRDLYERYAAVVHAHEFMKSALKEVLETMEELDEETTLGGLIDTPLWHNISDDGKAFVLWASLTHTTRLPLSVLAVKGVNGEWHRAFELIGEGEEDFVETPEMKLAREIFGGADVEFRWREPPESD